eukprot:7607420-Prorocentrum_lima.AAC.1
MERLVLNHHMLKTLWPREMLLPWLRNPASMDGIVYYIGTMLGEVSERGQEEHLNSSVGGGHGISTRPLQQQQQVD